MGSMFCHGNQSSDLHQKLVKFFPNPNDASDKFDCDPRYSCFKVLSDDGSGVLVCLRLR